MFLDQHSFRIGHSIFYNLEASRQEYLHALEYYPLLAIGIGFVSFLGYAYRTPTHQKLYKELGKSLGLGAVLGYSHSYYYKLQYLQLVDESYEVVKERFRKNPKLLRPSAQEAANNSIKNFGLSEWSEADVEDDWDFDAANQNLLEGTAEDETRERRAEVMSHIYGS